MKRFSLILTIVALALGMTQCRKPVIEPIAPVVSGGTITKTITFGTDDGGAKVNFEGNDLTKPKWETGDKLHVYAGSAVGSLYYAGTVTLTEGAGSANGTFSGTVSLQSETDECRKFFYFGSGVTGNAGTFTGDFTDQSSLGGVAGVASRLMMECTNPDKNGENSYSGTLKPIFAVMNIDVTTWTSGTATIKKLNGTNVVTSITVDATGTVSYVENANSKAGNATGITYNVAEHIIAIPPMSTGAKGDVEFTISRGTQMAQIKVDQDVIAPAARVANTQVMYRNFTVEAGQEGAYVQTTAGQGDATQIQIVPTEVPSGGNAFQKISIVKNLNKNKEYDDLQTAINEAESGNNLQLLSSVILNGLAYTGAKTLTLDLNGYGISPETTGFTGDALIAVNRGGDLTIAGTGVINSGNVMCAIKMTQNSNEGASGVVASLTVNGGTITGLNYGISGNGNRDNTRVTINGGTISSTAPTENAEGSIGIYQPQDGELYINGGTITGVNAGVEVRSGSFTMNGGVVTGTVTPAGSQANGNGGTVKGAGVAVSQHTTNKIINVAINGGTINGCCALYQTSEQNGNDPTKVTMSVSGGTFNASGNDVVYSKDKTGFITGGTYNLQPAASYVDPGMEAYQNGNVWNIQLKSTVDGVCRIGSQGYESLALAIAAVQNGQTIVMLQDVANAQGISVPSGKNFTVDFAGFEYLVGPAGAGSAGTATQAFQLLKNSNITFKNGTIGCTEYNKTYTWTDDPKGIAMIINNYCNLTLENMVIDGTNIAHNGNNVRYICSNNYGTATYTGNTTIIVPEGDVAFDVCYYKNGGYNAAPTVTWNSTGHIDGKIILDGGTFNLEKNLTVGKTIDVTASSSPAYSPSTLNLGSSTLTVNDDAVNGINTSPNPQSLIVVKRGGNLVVNGTTGSINAKGLMVGIKMTGYGEDTSGTLAKLTVNGGTIKGNDYAISGNGTRHDTEITINGGTIMGVKQNDNLGIYHPQRGTLTITGGTLKGYNSGVEMRAGTLNMTGGTVTGLATPTEALPNGNGSTVVGAGIAISQHTTQQQINVTISGGTVNGYTAFCQVSKENNNNPEQITMNITGGTFNATNGGINPIYSEDKHSFVSGGTFNTALDAYYVKDGYMAVKNGANWNVVPTRSESWANHAATQYATAITYDANNVATVTIANEAELALFAKSPINGVNENGKHTIVKLTANLDLGDYMWTPINMQCVDFYGGNHTVKNVYVVTTGANAGLFGEAAISTVKDLTIDGAYVTANHFVAAVAGHGLCGHFTECTVMNAILGNRVDSTPDNGDKTGAICGYLSGESTAEVTSCNASYCTISGYRDCGGLVGMANETAVVKTNVVTSVVLNNHQFPNPQHYTEDSQFNFGEVVGRKASTATISENTPTNVTIIRIK